MARSGATENIVKAKELLNGTFADYAKTMSTMTANSIEIYNAKAEEAAKSAKSDIESIFNVTVGLAISLSLAIFLSLLWIGTRLSKSVGTIAQELSEASSQVTSSVEQLTSAGTTLSQSSTETAASLEETVAALEEMSSMVQMNSDNAKQAASLSATSKEAA